MKRPISRGRPLACKIHDGIPDLSARTQAGVSNRRSIETNGKKFGRLVCSATADARTNPVKIRLRN